LSKNPSPSTPEPEPADYTVGYGKAPVATRFAKGVSGNPSGKPKGARNAVPALHEDRLRQIILQEAYRSIEIEENGRPLTVTMAQATVRALAIAAVNGKLHAQALFIRLLATVEEQNREMHKEFFDAMLDYKDKWEKALARRKKLGLSLPDPSPHPDHIAIDMVKGTAELDGPWTSEEKALLDECRATAEAEGKDLLDVLIAKRDSMRNEEASSPPTGAD
jgi:hypothetical protein